ncbi:hypothetical protein LX36DRAFT_660551 [Colletotrichum falcatum]|nr:hypothetical protein LX36DRAFT_660551 [Colletotrichum falcatum]
METARAQQQLSFAPKTRRRSRRPALGRNRMRIVPPTGSDLSRSVAVIVVVVVRTTVSSCTFSRLMRIRMRRWARIAIVWS